MKRQVLSNPSSSFYSRTLQFPFCIVSFKSKDFKAAVKDLSTIARLGTSNKFPTRIWGN